MVSSVWVDAIAHPREALVELYNPKTRDSFPETVASHFADIFRPSDAFNEIPTLCVDITPTDGSLVRFRAMVQDTSSSPEMYIAHHSNGKPGGWGLETGPEDFGDIDYSTIRECSIIWGVSIPGERTGSRDSTKGPYSRPSFPHKYPLADTHHVGVQIKIYNPSEPLKSTELHSFVGILTTEPMHATIETESPVLVPTLHVFYSEPLPPTIVPRLYPQFASEEAAPLFDELVEWVAHEALAGDTLASRWILLTLVGRVQSRNPPILPVSLTLSRFPPPPNKQSLPTLTTVLSHLAALFLSVPLSLSMLNTIPFSPVSPQSSEIPELHSGLLQLPKGSTLLLTEAGVSEGTLHQRGLENVHALQEVIASQRLDYVFPFARFPFETDLGVIIVADGKQSAFFETSLSVPFQASPGNSQDQGMLLQNLYRPASQVKIPPPKKLEAFRELIGSAKVGIITVSEETAEYIQDCFVADRRKERAPGDVVVTSEDLTVQLMAAKLLALTLQRDTVTNDIWDQAKALEDRRRARLRTQ